MRHLFQFVSKPIALTSVLIFASLYGCSHVEKSYNEASKLAAFNQLPLDQDPLFLSDSADSFNNNCDQRLKTLTANFAQLETPSQAVADISYLQDLDNFFIALDNSYSIAQLYENVHPDADMRSSAGDCQKAVENIFTNVSLSKAIYKQLSQIEIADPDAESNTVSTDLLTQRYHKKLLESFSRSGVDKSDAVREQVRQLNIEIADLGQQFSKNIRDDVRQITIDNKEDLAGLPQDYIDGLEKAPEGHWIISTDYPSVLPFLRYAQADDKRLAIYKVFLDRGYPANEAVLKAIISKRDQLAKTLGYPTYAAYVTEEAMIETSENAANFIDRIATMAEPRAERDYNELLAQLKQDQPEATSVGNWQKAYLEELVKKQNYQYDAKLVRQYFAYDQVKQGVFDLVSELFEVEIVPWQTEVWHPDVSAHKLRNKEGKSLGYFYLDMHPREGKYKHAAHFGINTGVASKQLPISALICNFPGDNKQLDADGKRSNRGLMEHRQVETFLHEFGHLMHSLIGGHQPWSSLSGISTERDFVEAPSQLLEEWVWDFETLKTFAVNAEGETIPKALVDKMRAARAFGKGTHIRNQMFYAALSLNYYSSDPEQLDLNKTLIQLQDQYSPFAYIEDTHFYANFGHLYGYSARYYTYMWSLVIAADMFAKFEQEGLSNADISLSYRDKVLAAGGTKDAADLVEDFLGRPFNYDAFINQLNAE